jgi:hypothetical protein
LLSVDHGIKNADGFLTFDNQAFGSGTEIDCVATTASSLAAD